MRATDVRGLNLWSVALVILVAGGFIITGWTMSRGLDRLGDSIAALQNQLPDRASLSDIEEAISSVADQQLLVGDQMSQLHVIQQTTQQTAALLDEIHTSLGEQSERFDSLQLSLLQLQADFPVSAGTAGSDGLTLVSDDAFTKVYQLMCGAIQQQPVDRVLYLVTPGDTLWQISARFTGNPALYGEIARANNLPANGSTIWPGQWIWIPTRLLSPTLRESQPNTVPPLVAEICAPYVTTGGGSTDLQLQLNL